MNLKQFEKDFSLTTFIGGDDAKDVLIESILVSAPKSKDYLRIVFYWKQNETRNNSWSF